MRPTIHIGVPVKIDLGEVLGIAPDAVRLIALILKAKKAKSDGGRSVTEEERQEIEDALVELLEDVQRAAD
jgi:hypothetical protein